MDAATLLLVQCSQTEGTTCVDASGRIERRVRRLPSKNSGGHGPLVYIYADTSLAHGVADYFRACK